MIQNKEDRKFAPANVLEGMTSISALINSGAENDRKIEKIWIASEKRTSKAAQIKFLTAKSHELGFVIEFVDGSQIDEMTVGNTHGGIVAFCSDRTFPTLTQEVIKKDGFYVYLDGVEDPYNFGYALRSLYAAGVDGIVLPPRNWMTAAGVVARASAGASELLPIFTASTETVISVFRSCGYLTLCAGIRDSVSIFDEHFPLPVLLVIGGEKRGISKDLLEQADKIVRIDYGRGFQGSLSAASAATVLGFEILRQNRKK